ncbi:unnamed protein product, partial [marine sediment metagenome]
RGSRIIKEKTFSFSNDIVPVSEWEAVGTETKTAGSGIMPIDKLSYAPTAAQIAAGDTWGARLRSQFTGMIIEGAPATAEQIKLAKQCIYKWYRWDPTVAATRENFLPWVNMKAAPAEVVVGGNYERAVPELSVKYVEYQPKSRGDTYVDHTTAVNVTDGWSLDLKKGMNIKSPSMSAPTNPTA